MESTILFISLTLGLTLISVFIINPLIDRLPEHNNLKNFWMKNVIQDTNSNN